MFGAEGRSVLAVPDELLMSVDAVQKFGELIISRAGKRPTYSKLVAFTRRTKNCESGDAITKT